MCDIFHKANVQLQISWNNILQIKLPLHKDNEYGKKYILNNLNAIQCVLIFKQFIQDDVVLQSRSSIHGKMPSSDQTPAKVIHAGEILRSEITNSLTNSVRIIEELPLISGITLLLYQFTRTVIKLTVVMFDTHHSYQLLTQFYPILFPQD
jgi:hypothetical protein